MVAPADGIVLYVRRFSNGRVPLVIKRNTPVPVEAIHRMENGSPSEGVIIGIFMMTYGVHVNRAPIGGKVAGRVWYNGPDVEMTRLEKGLILRSIIPGPEKLLGILGLGLSDLVAESDHILSSARETLVFEGDLRCLVVRIADYFVGEILTWVSLGELVGKGQRIGMITWGSQTDLIIEIPSGVSLETPVAEGDHVRAGETVVAKYAR